MWIHTIDGKLVNLAIVGCIEWFHLGPDSDKRDDIYDVRAQIGSHDAAGYVLARNLTQEEAQGLPDLITKHIDAQACLDLREYKMDSTELRSKTAWHSHNPA
jgi:hypothetical protein